MSTSPRASARNGAKTIRRQRRRQAQSVTSEGRLITTTHHTMHPNRREGVTRAELLALPVTVDIPTAARALGLGRSTAYELARRGKFPCRILRAGSSYRVPTADLLRILGIEPPIPATNPTAPPTHRHHRSAGSRSRAHAPPGPPPAAPATDR